MLRQRLLKMAARPAARHSSTAKEGPLEPHGDVLIGAEAHDICARIAYLVVKCTIDLHIYDNSVVDSRCMQHNILEKHTLEVLNVYVM